MFKTFYKYCMSSLIYSTDAMYYKNPALLILLLQYSISESNCCLSGTISLVFLCTQLSATVDLQKSKHKEALSLNFPFPTCHIT